MTLISYYLKVIFHSILLNQLNTLIFTKKFNEFEIDISYIILIWYYNHKSLVQLRTVDWEKSMMIESFEEFHRINLHRKKKDEQIWRDIHSQEYNVKSTYRKQKFDRVKEKFRYDVFTKKM